MRIFPVKSLNRFALLVVTLLMSMTFACSTSSPCPGSGKVSSSDLSAFDEGGSPKGRKSGRKSDNGLIKKKQPRRLNAR